MTKMVVTKLYCIRKSARDKVVCEIEKRRAEEAEAGYRIKNMNPTQRCGETCQAGDHSQ